MTYGVIMTMQAPVETYDTLHQELVRRTGGDIEGLLAHVARATEQGFQVIEVWESQDQFQRAHRELVWPLASEIFGDQSAAPEPAQEEFEVRGLVIPRSHIAV